MRRIRVLGPLLVFVACGHPTPPTAPESAPTCAPRAEAEAAVVKAIVDLYAAFKADDLAAFHAVTASDFYAFERGERFDGDALPAMVADAHAKGRRFEWTVTRPSVRVDCNLALVTYLNVGAVGDGSAMQPMSWLESAALTYDAGAWHVRFFHSTRVPKE